MKWLRPRAYTKIALTTIVLACTADNENAPKILADERTGGANERYTTFQSASLSYYHIAHYL